MTERQSMPAATDTPNRTKPKPYTGRSYDEIPVPLSDLMVGSEVQVFPDLVKNCFTIRLSEKKLIFAAGKYVGVIPINERVTIEVRPRVDTANLTRILSLSDIAPE